MLPFLRRPYMKTMAPMQVPGSTLWKTFLTMRCECIAIPFHVEIPIAANDNVVATPGTDGVQLRSHRSSRAKGV